MATDWEAARNLDRVVEAPRVPRWVQDVARDAARLIRELDEELDVRNQIITAAGKGEVSPAPAVMRARYAERLQAAIDNRRG